MKRSYTLKLKEISYIHFDAYVGMKLKQGSIDLIEKGTTVITLLTEEFLKDKIIYNNTREIYTRSEKIFAVINEVDETSKKVIN